MDKCTLCVSAREVGAKPACVKNCAGKALHYGDINDPESDVSKVLQKAGEENVFALRDFGNKPTTRYVLKRATWKDVLPHGLKELSSKKGHRL